VKTVTIHEAKTHLSRLIQQALDGEEIVIANRNEPMVRLEVVRASLPQRRFGALKSLVLEMGPSFDEPLEDFAEYAPTASKVAEEPAKYRA
jgi:antitoxin (DNA-binding transcriptional repressor) of toxin-antitoxin stability system